MEAITRKKEVDEVKVIRKSMQGAMLNGIDPAANDWRDYWNAPSTPTTPGDIGPWTAFYGSSGPRFWLQDTIDINGVTQLMDKALVPIHIEIQQADFYRCGGFPNDPTADPMARTEPSNYGAELVFLTTVPFDVDSWIRANLNTQFNGMRLPTIFGRLNTSSEKALSSGQCLFGRFRYLQNDMNTADRVALIKGESYFGELDKTMSDELYLTRILIWNGPAAVGAKFEVPDIQLHIHMTTEELSELSQIMELRRSYLTQQRI